MGIKTKKPAYEKKTTSLKCKQNPPYSCYSQKRNFQKVNKQLIYIVKQNLNVEKNKMQFGNMEKPTKICRETNVSVLCLCYLSLELKEMIRKRKKKKARKI